MALVHKDAFPRFVRESPVDCSPSRFPELLKGVKNVQTNSSVFKVRLPQQQKLAGYGLFPFSPLLGRKIRVDTDAGDFAWIRGDITYFGNDVYGWILVSVEALGIPAQLATEIKQSISRALIGVGARTDQPHERQTALPRRTETCFVATVIATHTHSGPDLVGLWGAAANSLNREKNREVLRTLLLEPLKNSIAEAAKQAYAGRKDSVVFVRRARVETNIQTDASPSENMSIILAAASKESPAAASAIGQKAGGNQASNLALWILDAHATTDPEDTEKVSGDFPEFVRLSATSSDGISSPHFVFMAGAIAGAYPPEKHDWQQNLFLKLAEEVRESASDRWEISRLVSQSYCVEVTSRLFKIFEAWATMWGGLESETCALGAGDRGSGDQIRGISVTLQRIDFRSAGAENNVLSVIFSPFELFVDVENLLKTRFRANIQGISLANGFLGHGLSQRQFCALAENAASGKGLSKKCADSLNVAQDFQRARVYHSLLSPFSEVESLLNDFLTY